MFKSNSSKSNSSKSNSSFKKRLLEIVNICDNHIGYWSDDGSRFCIINENLFIKVIMPITIGSFNRQLNYYGFSRTKVTKTEIHFKHEFFHRDKPELYEKIIRNTHKVVRKVVHKVRKIPTPIAPIAPIHTSFMPISVTPIEIDNELELETEFIEHTELTNFKFLEEVEFSKVPVIDFALS